MTKVSLLRCEGYDLEILKAKMRQGLAAIGFDLSWMHGKRVAIKPNLLSVSAPDQAIVTHPHFFRAAVRIVKEAGGKPILTESPAFQPLNKVLKAAGYDAIIAEEAVEVDPMTDTMVLMHDQGRKFKRFEVTKAIADVDVIINLPKYKTHGLTYITGAVKNLFGLIPGRSKTQWHLRANSREEFSEFLLDLYGAYLQLFKEEKRIVHIMDAIIGMDGNGPGASGNPRRIGAIISGLDGIAVDFVATNLVSVDVKNVITITSGARRGLGLATFHDIDVIGDNLDSLRIHDFKPAPLPFHTKLDHFPFLQNLIKNLMIEKPVPIKDKCILCYQCKQICPVGAIEKGIDVPLYDYDTCIRCFCCLEICPEAAIRIQMNIIQRLFKR